MSIFNCIYCASQRKLGIKERYLATGVVGKGWFGKEGIQSPTHRHQVVRIKTNETIAWSEEECHSLVVLDPSAPGHR